jgi:hypothetical protein
MAARVEQLRKQNPAATWAELLADDDVRLELGTGLAALVGIVGGLAGDQGAVAAFLKRFSLLVDATVLTPLLKRAWMDYNDPKLARDPEARSNVLQGDVAQIIGTIAAMIGAKHAARQQAKKAASEPAAAQPPTAPAEPPLAEPQPAAAEPPMLDYNEFTPDQLGATATKSAADGAQSQEGGWREYTPE